MEDYEAYNAITRVEHELSDSTASTFEMIQDPEIASQIGLSSDETIDQLGRIFAKYEIPIGLMNKLMELREYDMLEFIIDDSGSMTHHSDTTVDLYTCHSYNAHF